MMSRYATGARAFIGCTILIQPARAAGFYISEVGAPGSLGTAGVANPVNTVAADSSWTNPAGMTGFQKDDVLFGAQVVMPKVEFDSSVADKGGKDGAMPAMTQIWIALCIYLLLAFIKFQSGLKKSTQQILRLLQLNLFEKRDLMALLRGDPPRDNQPDINQMILL